MSHRHEWNQSENRRFTEACEAAGLSESEMDRFSDEFHNMRDRERMSYNEIKSLVAEWKANHGGGFRRSDRR
jgi:hypothetical protein